MWNLNTVVHKRRMRGFTLLEVMIVVLIISLLLMIAIPQFYTARMRSQQTTCMNNLRQIVYAKEMLAHNKSLSEGAPTTINDIWPDYIRSPGKPICPAGGDYSINPIGTDPTCTINIGPYAHLAP
jgi:prepilin-type N-terminal cleavage/methylation domain-containing protein